MSLDLFVANNLEEAAISETGAAISHQNHKCIMVYASPSEYPMLMRMSNYLADTSFGPTEVPLLLQEIQRIKNLIPTHSATQQCIFYLIETCRHANEQRRGIYAV